MSRAAARETELRRALWRHEYGQLSSTRMQELLDEAYEEVTRAFAELESGVAAARRHRPDLLAGRDTFRARAHAAIRGERFREAVDAVVAGQRALAELRALAEACDRIAEAEAAVARLREAEHAPALRALACMAAPARLVALAREHLARKRYGPAVHLAGAARAECAPLERRDGRDPARLAELEARLARIAAVCADTRELAAEGEDAATHAALLAAAALAREGRLALAERAADELAFSLAARERFCRELHRSGGTVPEGALLRRGAEGDDAWSAATAALWASRLEAGLRRTAEQRERLDRTRARLPSPPVAEPARPPHPLQLPGGPRR